MLYPTSDFGFNAAVIGTGAAGFSNPRGLALSPTGSLFVATANSNRVLRFDNAATLPNTQPNASAVLGQLDFTGTGPGISATQMNSPTGLFVTPEGSLWVCDRNNHRILRFDTASTLPSVGRCESRGGTSEFHH